MNEEKRYLWTVRSKRRYIYLCSKGIYPVEIEPNIDNPNFRVWKYEQTQELFNALKEYNAKYDI